MAKYAESDPQDWEIWQANHSDWSKLVNAEMEHRGGRTPGWYRDLLDTVDGRDAPFLATSGSSTSRLSATQAFQRGYQGGWR
jgi:hypothetical protein